MTHLSQATRFVLFVMYVGLLSALANATMGRWVPLPNEFGLWFYSGVAALLAGALLDAPTHTTPTQAVSGSFVGLAAILAYGLGTWHQLDAIGRLSFQVGLTILAVCFFAAALAILLKDASPGGRPDSKLRESGYVLGASLGRPAIAAPSFSSMRFSLISGRCPPASPSRSRGVFWCSLGRLSPCL